MRTIRSLNEIFVRHNVRISRKRLALLTAYLEDRPIYIFDEWAADQDPLFKSVFYLQLLPELRARGKAVVVISHDDQYYGVADELMKLTYGKVEGEPQGEHTSSRLSSRIRRATRL